MKSQTKKHNTKNTSNHVIINTEIRNFMIQSNQDEPLLHNTKISIIATLL